MVTDSYIKWWKDAYYSAESIIVGIFDSNKLWQRKKVQNLVGLLSAYLFRMLEHLNYRNIHRTHNLHAWCSTQTATRIMGANIRKYINLMVHLVQLL